MPDGANKPMDAIFPESGFLWNENYKNGERLVAQVGEWMRFVTGAEDETLAEADLFNMLADRGATLNATCTDERQIDIAGSVRIEDQENMFIRVVGGAAGILHAFEAVMEKHGVFYDPRVIDETLTESGVIGYNHRDNVHGTEEDKRGCGYLGLLTMDQAAAVFERSIAGAHEHITEMEGTLDIPTLVLQDEHVAQNGGLLISLYRDRTLEPGNAGRSFFSCDLGVLAERIEQTGEALLLEPDLIREVLVTLVRDNMSACFVLSGGNIEGSKFIVTGPEDENLKKIISEAYAEFSEEKRIEAMNSMIDERSHHTH